MNSLPPRALGAPSSLRRVGRSERGSVLIVAMLFATIVALSIASYLTLGQTNMRVSNRAFYANAAMNIAESGMEQAMWSINKMVDEDPAAWTNWDSDANGAWRKFDGFKFDQNATGYVRVYVRNHTGFLAPRMVARSTITPVQGTPIEKWIQVELSKRSRYSNGLVAKNTLMFSGNGASVDSYDSRKGAYNATLADGTKNRYANGTAGSGAVAIDSFNLGNADIWGYVSIGTPDMTGLDVGPNGTVSGDLNSTGEIDESRVITDFKPDIEEQETPENATITIPKIDDAIELPLAGDIAAGLADAKDGKYYYSVPSIDLTKLLLITPGYNVVLLVTTTTGSAVKISGNGMIEVPATSTLAMYTEGDISIAGKGVANANDPSAFTLVGTRPSDAATTQSISISGNGQLSAIVDAPNADVSMSGGGASGSIYGAVIANNITVTGGSAFHYDEALADMTTGNPYGITSWTELTTAGARATYEPYLSF